LTPVVIPYNESLPGGPGERGFLRGAKALLFPSGRAL